MRRNFILADGSTFMHYNFMHSDALHMIGVQSTSMLGLEATAAENSNHVSLEHITLRGRPGTDAPHNLDPTNNKNDFL